MPGWPPPQGVRIPLREFHGVPARPRQAAEAVTVPIMHAEETDIFVSGGGIAGLVAALGLADAGLSVTLADPAPPPAGDNCGDLRSTAFLEPSRRQLEAIGIWNALGDVATPLEVLCVANCMGDPPWIETERSFRAADLGIPALGWNLPNA
ncbi:MAG: FAD-binding protein, partial [Boseongicola sp. SB0670_bin_30]|nr:FAD-binding protein [Boseongicola sp. SB0670_bin_30]